MSARSGMHTAARVSKRRGSIEQVRQGAELVRGGRGMGQASKKASGERTRPDCWSKKENAGETQSSRRCFRMGPATRKMKGACFKSDRCARKGVCAELSDVRCESIHDMNAHMFICMHPHPLLNYTID